MNLPDALLAINRNFNLRVGLVEERIEKYKAFSHPILESANLPKTRTEFNEWLRRAYLSGATCGAVQLIEYIREKGVEKIIEESEANEVGGDSELSPPP